MKVISIIEPWATLIKEGKKYIETRSWKTNYRGEIYIHASAKKISKSSPEIQNLLKLIPDVNMNYGCIVCKANYVRSIVSPAHCCLIFVDVEEETRQERIAERNEKPNESIAIEMNNDVIKASANIVISERTSLTEVFTRIREFLHTVSN